MFRYFYVCIWRRIIRNYAVSFRARTLTHAYVLVFSTYKPLFFHAFPPMQHTLAASTPAVARTRVYQNLLYTLVVAVVVLNFIATSMCNLPARTYLHYTRIHMQYSSAFQRGNLLFGCPKRTQ